MENQITKEARQQILKDLGYYVQWHQRSNEGIDSAHKEIRDYKYQHHEYKGKSWTDFDVYSKRGILEKMSDDDFNAFVSAIPELEKQKRRELAEFVEDAKYHKSIEEGVNKIENKNIIDDGIKLRSAISDIRKIIKEADFKSLKFKGVFDSVLESIDKLQSLQ